MLLPGTISGWSQRTKLLDDGAIRSQAIQEGARKLGVGAYASKVCESALRTVSINSVTISSSPCVC